MFSIDQAGQIAAEIGLHEKVELMAWMDRHPSALGDCAQEACGLGYVIQEVMTPSRQKDQLLTQHARVKQVADLLLQVCRDLPVRLARLVFRCSLHQSGLVQVQYDQLELCPLHR